VTEDSGKMGELADGVWGYTRERGGELWIPLFQVTNTDKAGTYLDSLPKDRRVVFPNVMELEVESLLEARGFELLLMEDPQVGASYPAWCRDPA